MISLVLSVSSSATPVLRPDQWMTRAAVSLLDDGRRDRERERGGEFLGQLFRPARQGARACHAVQDGVVEKRLLDHALGGSGGAFLAAGKDVRHRRGLAQRRFGERGEREERRMAARLRGRAAEARLPWSGRNWRRRRRRNRRGRIRRPGATRRSRPEARRGSRSDLVNELLRRENAARSFAGEEDLLPLGDGLLGLGRAAEIETLDDAGRLHHLTAQSELRVGLILAIHRLLLLLI